MLPVPVAPHSDGREFPQLEQYRGMVEGAVFNCLGRPSFFDAAVDQLMGRIGARIKEKRSTVREKARRESDGCAGAPQEGGAGIGGAGGAETMPCDGTPLRGDGATGVAGEVP
jgi:hypothetical protein